METLFLSLLLLLFTLFLVLSLRILFPQFHGRKNLPPGKLGFPILGETLQFLSTGRKGTPENFIKERANKYSPDVFKTSFYGEKIAVLCGPAGNKFLFSNENKLVSAWFPRSIEKIFPSSLQTSSKEEAVRNRKLLNGFLKPEALRKYVDVMDRIAIKHIETNWDFKKEVTVFPLANQYTLELACKLLLSIEDPKHIAKFSKPFEALSAGMFAVPINFPGTSFNGAIKGSEKIRKELEEIIRERKNDLMEKKLIMSAKQDILSYMLTTADENGQFMNEMNIADKIMGLLVGAHDSASAAITSIIKYLAELPHVYNEVLKEQIGVAASKPHGEPLNWEDLQKMKYSWNVASEVLRLAPPAQGNFREAIVDFTYAGFSIPKSWKLYWSVNSTHKNPEYFPEPEKFDPSRFEGSGPIPYTYVPFGGGPRMCPGKEFVRLEILIFMHNVVRRFKWEKLVPDEKIIVKPLFMPEKGLPIRLYPH